MLAQVLNNGQSSDDSPVTNGVKQGCVLYMLYYFIYLSFSYDINSNIISLTLFSILFTTMLSNAFSDDKDPIKLCFYSDGNLFNLRRVQA